jgi:hypothetical protein
MAKWQCNQPRLGGAIPQSAPHRHFYDALTSFPRIPDFLNPNNDR